MNRILVIDDELNITEMIREVLTRFGYTVRTAADGRQGMEQLKKSVYDLVVTDMCMPDLEGAQIVRFIRNSERCHTPVIGISGTPWLFEQTDCDAVLPKPFHLKELVDTVDHLMRQELTPGVGGSALSRPFTTSSAA